MNMASSGGRSPIRSYNAVIARRSGVAWPARAASSSVLLVAGGAAKAAANTSCMTAIAAGNSKGCGPACSPATTGLQ